MKPILTGIVWLYILSGLAACSSSTVVTDMDSLTDLSQYRSFAYLPALSDMSTQGDTFDYDYSAVLQAMDEITEEMQAIGYRLDLEQPDLLVITHMVFSQDETLQREPIRSSYAYADDVFEGALDYPYYYSGYEGLEQVYGYEIDEVEPENGALVVDIIHRQSRELLWRGWVKGDFSPEALKKDLRSYIDDIFVEYPLVESHAEQTGQ